MHRRPRLTRAVVVLEVPDDRVAPGVEFLGDKIGAELDDQRDSHGVQRPRRASRATSSHIHDRETRIPFPWT